MTLNKMSPVLLKPIGDVDRPSCGPKLYFNQSAHLDHDTEFRETL
jgi:hypothetical protein